MTDINDLKRAVNTARSAYDKLLAAARRGEHVAPSTLGQASRELTASEAAALAEEEAAELAAKREAILKMAPGDYEAERVKLVGGSYRRTLA
jgi:hypothetical protein